MSKSQRPHFEGGKNIAMKLPPHLFDQTVVFYRDTLGLPPLRVEVNMCGFQFGAVELWLDRVQTISQAELWLQVDTPDAVVASAYLEQEGTVRCDEIEPLPNGFEGFWISSPAHIVHLVSQSDK
jgi:catechol 2,3-dioxygenase-like lactoylglutathione lyase family enzyme